MLNKRIKVVVAASMLLGAPVPAMASDFGAALVGGIIGGALSQQRAAPQRQRVYRKAPQRSKQRSTVSSAQRSLNRETQTSLNYFGFDAGGADGVMGSRSRAAMSRYQAFLGYPSTGQLTTMERDLLVSSYNRAQIGGADVITAMQRDPQGVRGLLLTWRDERLGIRTAGARASTGYAGMPMEVSEAIDEIADSSEPSAEQLLQRTGFIHLADLNGDGRNDYVIDTAVTGSSFWCGQTQCAVLVFASQPEGYRRNEFRYLRNTTLSNTATPAMFSCHQSSCSMEDPLAGGGTLLAGGPAAPAGPAPASPQAPVMAAAPATPDPASGMPALQALPFASAAKPAQPSLASYCSKVGMLTSSNGGYVTLATMTDPEFALSEQFCLTRTYSIARGEELVQGVQGMSAAQIEAQCDAFGPALASQVAMLDTAEADEVVAQVQKFALNSAMTSEQLRSTGEICLFTGYRRDKLDVAVGAALLLVGSGQAPYAELIGHHVAQGFGARKSADRAQGWYRHALDALDAGAEPIFVPGQNDRVELLRTAVSGDASAGDLPSAQPAGLPNFSLK